MAINQRDIARAYHNPDVSAGWLALGAFDKPADWRIRDLGQEAIIPAIGKIAHFIQSNASGRISTDYATRLAGDVWSNMNPIEQRQMIAGGGTMGGDLTSIITAAIAKTEAAANLVNPGGNLKLASAGGDDPYFDPANPLLRNTAFDRRLGAVGVGGASGPTNYAAALGGDVYDPKKGPSSLTSTNFDTSPFAAAGFTKLDINFIKQLSADGFSTQNIVNAGKDARTLGFSAQDHKTVKNLAIIDRYDPNARAFVNKAAALKGILENSDEYRSLVDKLANAQTPEEIAAAAKALKDFENKAMQDSGVQGHINSVQNPDAKKAEQDVTQQLIGQKRAEALNNAQLAGIPPEVIDAAARGDPAAIALIQSATRSKPANAAAASVDGVAPVEGTAVPVVTESERTAAEKVLAGVKGHQERVETIVQQGVAATVALEGLPADAEAVNEDESAAATAALLAKRKAAKGAANPEEAQPPSEAGIKPGTKTTEAPASDDKAKKQLVAQNGRLAGPV